MKCIVQSPTGNLQKSLAFYKKLLYKVLSDDNITLVTDGKAEILINNDRLARAGIRIYRESWNDLLPGLKEVVHVVSGASGYFFADPSGMLVYLEEEQWTIPSKSAPVSSAIPGNFMGVSLETTDMAKCISIWKILGFSITMGDPDKGWVVLSEPGGFAISFMKAGSCPHLFFNPSLTYFNGDKNPSIIAKIRDLGIPLIEEITHFNKEGKVDNVIIRDPGGLGFFIFND